LRSKRCLHQGCNKHPSCGVDGSNKMEFCSEHKREGMARFTVLGGRRSRAASRRRYELGRDSEGGTGQPERATGKKRARDLPASAQSDDDSSGGSGGGKTKQARLGAVAPQVTPSSVRDQRKTTLDGYSSSELNAAVKTEPVSAQAVHERQFGRRSGPHGIPLCISGDRSG